MPDFKHLTTSKKDLDERPYNHAVRVPPVDQKSRDAQNRFTFYPDNKLRWLNNRRSRHTDTGWAIYTFPDQVTASKFAERFGGVYLGQQNY